MANEILLKPKTALVWKGAPGSGELALTLKNKSDGGGRMGAKTDFGAVYPGRYAVGLLTKFASAPTAGNIVKVYWAASHDDSHFPGGATGSDGDFTPGDNERQLELLGCLVVLANTSAQYQVVGVFEPPTRYGAPVVVNASGQTLTNSDADHVLTLVPVAEEIQ